MRRTLNFVAVGLRWVTAVCLVALASGCAAVVVGGATGAGVAYSMGSLDSVENAPLDRTYVAAQAALKDLEFSTTTATKDALEGRVEAETSSEKSVTIKLKRVTDTATEVKIRVGTFGDQKVSLLLLEKLRTHL